MKLRHILLSIIIELLIPSSGIFAARSPSPTRPAQGFNRRSPSPTAFSRRSPSPVAPRTTYQRPIIHRPIQVVHRPAYVPAPVVIHRPVVPVVINRPAYIPAPVHVVHHPRRVHHTFHTQTTTPSSSTTHSTNDNVLNPPSKFDKLTIATLLATASAFTAYAIVYANTPEEEVNLQPGQIKTSRSHRAFEKFKSGFKNPFIFAAFTAVTIGTGYWICKD